MATDSPGSSSKPRKRAKPAQATLSASAPSTAKVRSWSQESIAKILEAKASMLSPGGAVPHGTESDVIGIFLDQCATGRMDELLPWMSPSDTIVREMAFRHGRADLCIFHLDGTATVIEAKDGARGYSHVVAGIGQAGLYAVQLASAKGALSKVRKALLWSSTGCTEIDAAITAACSSSCVIPLPYPSTRDLMAAKAAVAAVLAAQVI